MDLKFSVLIHFKELLGKSIERFGVIFVSRDTEINVTKIKGKNLPKF